MNNSTSSPRNSYFDILRGLAIIMVVGIHTFTPPHLSDCNTSIYDWIDATVRQAIQFPVPLFLAISGYFLAKKKLETKDECKRFWKKQIPRVYIPCLIWSIPHLLLSLRAGESNPFVTLAFYFLCGLSVYYFILLIMQCYLLLPFILKTNIRRILKLTMITYVIHMLAYFYAKYGLNIDIPLVVYGAPFTLLGVYFVLGVSLSRRDRNYSLTLPVLGMIAGMILQLIEMYFINTNLEGGFGIKVSSLLYCYSCLMFLFSAKVEKWVSSHTNIITKWLNKIGNVSFGVYLTHIYFIMFLSKFFTIDNYFAKWAVVSLLSIAFVMVGKRIMPVFSEKYLGFK